MAKTDRTRGAGELNRHLADPARPAQHQYALPRLQPGAVHQTFPCGNEDQRKGSGLTHVESGGFLCQQRFGHGDELRQRALMPADAADHAEHLVPGPKARALTRYFPDRIYYAGTVDAEHAGEWLVSVGCGAGADLPIQRIEPRSGQANQHLARPQGGLLDFGDAKGAIGLVDDRDSHQILSCSWAAEIAAMTAISRLSPQPDK